MPKFTVTVARDATAYYPLVVEAKDLEEAKSHCAKYGYSGTILEELEASFQSFDDVEGYRIQDATGEEVYDSQEEG